jgi:hypothetical protein
MANPPQGNSGPFRFGEADYADMRDERALAHDAQIVRRQLNLLTENHDRIRAILETLRRGQDESTAPDRVPFDIWQTGATEDSFVLCGRDTLVVQEQSEDRLDPGVAPGEELSIEGYERVPEGGDTDIVPPVGRRTAVFRSTRSRTPAELTADAQTLVEQGIPASLDYVVPLGHIVKGDDFPEPAAELRREYPPPRPPQVTGKGTAVRVAVIDTGIAAEVRQDGWLTNVGRGPADIDRTDIMPPVDRLDWFAGHGTFTAGVVQQMAPSCEIVAYRFTTGDGIGTESDLAAAVLRAAEEAPKDGYLIINLSVGTPAVGGLPPLALQNAVEYVARTYPNALMVASAGNNGNADPMYPAAFNDVVAVGALTADLKHAPFSSFGSWVTCSCIGAGVVSTYVEGVSPPQPLPDRDDVRFGPNSFAVWSGTSFTAPQISGIIARMCQEQGYSPRAALAELLANRTTDSDFGFIIDGLLPGTPA